jgi:hypothetical protein
MQSASVYVRLCREARASNLSLEAMVAETRAHAERLGYQVTAEHVDEGTPEPSATGQRFSHG